MIAHLTRKSVDALHKTGHQFVHRGWTSRSLRISQTKGGIGLHVTVSDPPLASAGPVPVGCRLSLQLIRPIESMACCLCPASISSLCQLIPVQVS